MKLVIFWQLWSWLMSRYVLYMLGLIMGIHCIVSVIEVAAESPACGCFWSRLDCQAVSPSILILSRWLSVAKDWCVYPCMVSGSRYIISWIDTGLVNPCRVPTWSNFVAGSWKVWVKLGVSCMSVVVRQRVNVEYNGTGPSWLALFVWCRSTSLTFDPNAYI